MPPAPTVNLGILKDRSLITVKGHTMAVVRIHAEGQLFSKAMGWRLTILETGPWTQDVAKQKMNQWLSRYIKNEPGIAMTTQEMIEKLDGGSPKAYLALQTAVAALERIVESDPGPAYHIAKSAMAELTDLAEG